MEFHNYEDLLQISLVRLRFQLRELGNAEKKGNREIAESVQKWIKAIYFFLSKENKKFNIEDAAATLETTPTLLEYFKEKAEMQYCFQLMLKDAIEEIEKEISIGNIQKALDCSDAIHAIPSATTSKNWDALAYWNDFIRPYKKKWNDDFFEKYRHSAFELPAKRRWGGVLDFFRKN